MYSLFLQNERGKSTREINTAYLKTEVAIIGMYVRRTGL